MDAFGRGMFLLDPDVVHLNHGSFGAVPVPVLEAQRQVSHTIERSPERFYRADLAPAIDAARAAVASFLHCEVDGVALVENATHAVQVVLQAVAPKSGEEIVVTDHTYPWVLAAVRRTCQRTGARMREIVVPLDATGRIEPSRMVAQVMHAVHDGTALVILDQITSASAVRVPVEEVAEALHTRAAAGGRPVPLLVDGAHAPGSLDQPVTPGAAFWLGNLHKWAFAARTVAALVVAPAWRDRVTPLVESAGAAEGFPRSFTYLGTQDPSAALVVPISLAFPDEHLGLSFAELRQRNCEVLARGLERIAEAFPITVGPDPGMPMRTLSWGRPGDAAQAARWTASLREEDGIEVAITSVRGVLHARVSVQAYVSVEDVAALGEVLARRERWA